MNDLEKAKEISDIYMPDTGFNREDLYDAAMQMAQWKDEQLGWHDAKKEQPPMDEEVIVLTNILNGKELSTPRRICFGHIVERIYVFDKSCQVSTIEAYIQPIPLTPEILEKNGFTKGYGVWVIYRHPLIKWFVLYKKEFGYAISVGESEVNINYVHELQHALKLCGIEKTIEL